MSVTEPLVLGIETSCATDDDAVRGWAPLVLGIETFRRRVIAEAPSTQVVPSAPHEP